MEKELFMRVWDNDLIRMKYLQPLMGGKPLSWFKNKPVEMVKGEHWWMLEEYYPKKSLTKRDVLSFINLSNVKWWRELIKIYGIKLIKELQSNNQPKKASYYRTKLLYRVLSLKKPLIPSYYYLEGMESVVEDNNLVNDFLEEYYKSNLWSYEYSRDEILRAFLRLDNYEDYIIWCQKSSYPHLKYIDTQIGYQFDHLLTLVRMDNYTLGIRILNYIKTRQLNYRMNTKDWHYLLLFMSKVPPDLVRKFLSTLVDVYGYPRDKSLQIRLNDFF